jgi:Zn-dependent protease/predicted transcriptional regulator
MKTGAKTARLDAPARRLGYTEIQRDSRMPRGAGLKIGRVLGIPIYLHSSWFLIFALITYSYASELALTHSGWSDPQRWAVGVLVSLLFFSSLLFHELSHSVVAMHFRIPVASITLFVFGGIARITREPDSAGQEFQIAAAGPLSSYLLAGGFFLLAMLSPRGSMPKAVGETLSWINLGLATFNLLPGFPLDGGRIFRSIVWGITKNYTRSTRIAARGGQVIAFAMMGAGLFIAVRSFSSGGDVVGGLWLAFIGFYLLSAARQSYVQVEAHGALEGLRVADIMTAELPSVPRDITLEEYAQEVARTGRRAHLVVSSDGQLAGLMTVEALQAVPRDEWDMTSVQAAMLSRDGLQWAAPEESALALLERMRNADVEEMAVVNGGNLVGLVTRDSITRVVESRVDLGHLANAKR